MVDQKCCTPARWKSRSAASQSGQPGPAPRGRSRPARRGTAATRGGGGRGSARAPGVVMRANLGVPADRRGTRLSETCRSLYGYAHDRTPWPSPVPVAMPGVRSSGCCSPIPSVEIGALTGGSNAGDPARRASSRTWCRWRTGRWRRPRPRCWPVTTWSSSALPHGQSGEIAAALPEGVVVIDCGADFRLTDPAAWERFYGGTARRRLALRPARAARPAREARAAPPGSRSPAATRPSPRWPSPRRSPPAWSTPDVVVVAASGTSGAGKAAKPHLLGSEVMGNASAYGVGGVHRHTPEITQNLSLLTDGRRARQLHPGAGADAARHPGHLLRAAGRRRSRRRGVRRLRHGVRRRAVRPRAARRGRGRRPSR